uniref:Roadblock/LAMTOR2 domain-containing protein n=1 Tax=Corethron hystrix TaxID=216773 RepID=A0A7S1BKQ5_9STRA|mmetsp:Transcript_30548/g.69906  ORF Transcript_30548/g.69906 Transcript_30548/m.69906 type:complete len:125 (+) Transcript_30548:397-771(+)|eukprot:CAMPEP_0113314576 /NCGR_PEP_ID=MMETSP0010_2-20120614/10579_1 /TAXON_ID=216773 ORGANISM="Corethron hystrix, Strain 308" /NCGR_SAMPLE_ID=MMETSP0010_2 /ASSEMBLY_ACC=CAM_ASM_000155 /LENGTH=124 /DNA_ID=CAMNT_0000170885 /DNA_START=303 /DNA_END=677 /DNA_ORIENTATION=- /assembly_acc=CAM_ASM_000155
MSTIQNTVTSPPAKEAAAPTDAASNINSSEVEEILARIGSHKGVEGILVMTKQGVPIRSTIAADHTNEHSAILSQLADRASAVIRSLDPDDELTFLRMRTKMGYEYMIVPDKDYVLVVIQSSQA